MSGGDCTFCHTLEDMHGEGNEYNSMLEHGAIDAKCSDCHTDVSSVGGLYHSTHLSTVDCSTCHMQTVVTCYNCHFEGQTGGRDDKFARTQIKNWVFLLNRNGKVHPANFQSLEYQGDTWAVFVPFYSHTSPRTPYRVVPTVTATPISPR